MSTKIMALLQMGILISTLNSYKPKQSSIEALGLDKLVQIHNHLNKGGGEFLKGGDLATAFRPWDTVAAIEASKVDALRAELKKAGVTSLTNIGFELEFIFFAEGTAIYHLRTFVYANQNSISFLNFDGERINDGRIYVSSAQLDAFTGQAEPFREAAKALIEAFKGNRCVKLPFADAKAISKLITFNKARAEIVSRLERSRQNLTSTCFVLASLKFDEVRIRIDDQSFLARGSDDSTKGIVRGTLGLGRGNKISYSLDRFIPFEGR